MNKHFGLFDWLESDVVNMNNDNGQQGIEDGGVTPMDPDVVLLRPIIHDFTNEDVIFLQDKPASKMAKHGRPMAQQDGHLDSKWMNTNGTFVTDPNIAGPKKKFGPLHWNTGPPHLTTVKDMDDICLLWTDHAPRLDHMNPGPFC